MSINKTPPVESATVHAEILAPGFEEVLAAFEDNFTERGELGAAFAVYRDGQPVVDLWGGFADPQRSKPWDRDTLVLMFSGTKGIVAVCLLMLVERGLLDLEAPMSHYWPELARNGKSGLLVEHVVSHRAGLPGVRVELTNDDVVVHEVMVGHLEREAPYWEPGTQLCYHPLTFGWLCGELLRRIDGRSIGRFFAEEVAEPLGLEAWIGLPEEQEPRVATLTRGDQWDQWISNVDRDPLAASIWDNPRDRHGDPLLENSRAYRATEVPGANGVVTARSMARLYGCLASGGTIDVRLLSPETLAIGRRCLARGIDPLTAESLAFGVGFELQTETLELGPPTNAFGHSGAGGSVHGAWPDRGIGFSYTMNELRGTYPDPRAQALLRALYAVT